MVYLSSLRGMSTNIFTINSSFYPLRPLFIYSPSSHLLIHTRIVVRSRIRRISSLSFSRSLVLLFSPILFAISNLAINRRVPVNRGETRVNLASERASERASIREEGGSLRFFGTGGPLRPKRLRLLAAVNATKTTPRFDTHPWTDPPPSFSPLDSSTPRSVTSIVSASIIRFPPPRIGSDRIRGEERRSCTFGGERRTVENVTMPKFRRGRGEEGTYLLRGIVWTISPGAEAKRVFSPVGIKRRFFFYSVTNR